MEGKTQETAAAKAGMSVRSARKWQSGPLPSQAKPEHRWRTRPDPFDGVWEDEIEPLLRNDPTGKLKADNYRLAGRAASRAVQRVPAAHPATTIEDWRALHGPEREVYFPQVHPPGREAQFDFTHCGELKVTIAGQSYPHLLFQLILSHSGWATLRSPPATFLALQQGLQNALWTLGGVPEVVRSDNTSAATHELRSSRGRALNDNYAALLDHYAAPPASIPTMKTASPSTLTTASRTPSTRPSSCGAAAISTPPTTDASFVRQMVERRNRLVQGKLERSCFAWAPCPQPRCGIRQLPVQGAQVVQVAGHSYSVPSRLIGKRCRSVCTPTGWK